LNHEENRGHGGACRRQQWKPPQDAHASHSIVGRGVPILAG
jgi:hypothetical protein